MSPTTPRRRTIRVALLVLGTALASAAIGFGGLAAWSVTTQNNGSSFAAGSVHHTNSASLNGVGPLVTCSDTTSPASCGIIFSKANAKPGDTISGTVKIINTGNLQSTFTVALASAPVASPGGNTICTDLTLKIVDNEAGPVTVYNAALSALPTTSIRQSAGSINWATSDTGTYTFTLTFAGSPALTSMGGTCTAAVLFTQTNT